MLFLHMCVLYRAYLFLKNTYINDISYRMFVKSPWLDDMDINSCLVIGYVVRAPNST